MSVYFAQAGKDGPIKVGTAKDVAKRIMALAGACPDAISLLAVIDGGHALERRIHRALREHHRRLEWFNASREVRALVLVAHHTGAGAVLRWLDQKEAETQFVKPDFVSSEDNRADILWFQDFAISQAVARHGRAKVATAMGVSVSRLDAREKGRELPVTRWLSLEALDPGACLPLYRFLGVDPTFPIEEARDALNALLGKLAPRSAAR